MASRGLPGVQKSPETRAKMKAAQLASWTPERREKARSKPKGKDHYNYGRKAGPEEIEKRRKWMQANAPNLGKVASAETRAKLSESHLGKSPRLIRYGVTPEQYTAELEKGNAWCYPGKHFVPAGGINSSGACPDCKSAHYRRSDLKTHFGVTPEWYDQKLAEQGGGCAVCGGGPSKGDRNLAVDHDHKTGAIRGILCHYCNTALERIEEIPNWALLVAGYLSRYA
jgi:hypothetical protein